MGAWEVSIHCHYSIRYFGVHNNVSCADYLRQTMRCEHRLGEEVAKCCAGHSDAGVVFLVRPIAWRRCST